MAPSTPGLPDYRRVGLNVRPPRLATAFYGGEGWEVAAQRLIEGYARCWGGAGNVLVPVQAGEVHPAIWRVLKRYDADRWGYYATTRHGWRLAQPDAFEQWLDRQASMWVEQHGGSFEEARELLSADHLMSSPLNGAPEDLAPRIRREMAPDARREDDVFTVSFAADAKPGPYVGLARITESPSLRVPAVEGLPVHLQLLIRMRTGDLAPTHRRELLDAGVEIEDTPVSNSDLSAILGLAWGGYDSGHYRLRTALVSRLSGNSIDTPAFADDEYVTATPFNNTIAGCGIYHLWHPAWDERPFVVVAGAGADDFALALALDRCYSASAWFPTALEGEYREVATSALAHTLYRVGTSPDRALLITSTSAPDNQLVELVQCLKAEPWASELSLAIVNPGNIPLLPAQRIIEKHRFGQEEHVLPFVDSVLAGRLPPVIPNGPETPSPESLTWQIDLNIEGFTAPPRWCLNEAVQQVQGWRDTNMRVSADGPSYMSMSMGFISAGSTLQQRIARPRLRLPNGIEVIDLLARTAGLAAMASAAGRFTAAMIELFGGLESCGNSMRDPIVGATLRGYLSGARRGTQPGVFLESVSRRFVTLDDVMELAQVGAEQARVSIDGLLTQKAVDRGLVLGCERCSHAAFYPLAELSRTFTCNRCGSSASILQRRWKQPISEPCWYYALDEVVFQALRLDAWDVVHILLTLQRDTHAFLWTPQTEFRDGDEVRGELDVLAIADGRLIVGEAKRNDRLESSERAERRAAARLVGLADSLTADTLVLATRTAWCQRTRDAVLHAAEGHDLEIRFLENVGT